MVGGGVGGIGIGAMTLSTLYHRGGVVGAGGGSKVLRPANNNAPRLHKGLSSNEFDAVPESGERVQTRLMAGREAGQACNRAVTAKSGCLLQDVFCHSIAR